MQPLRILIVEDFEAFRRLIRILLEPHPDFEIVGEESDGLAAIQKAADLKPHLVLLDISLPSLDGFGVARMIRERDPYCNIIFVSQESSPPAVQAAMSLGAAGFVFKTKLASDLLPAIAAACEGKQFVSKNAIRRSPS
jgi:two-component system nitrate/nitrite response regulator NarL